MKTKLSDAQFVALLWMVEHGEGRIERWPGGFWTIPKMLAKTSRVDAGRVPRWHTGTQTVMALERLGAVKRADSDYSVQHWLAPRAVTERGITALADAVADGQTLRAVKKWNLADDLKLQAVWKYVCDGAGAA